MGIWVVGFQPAKGQHHLWHRESPGMFTDDGVPPLSDSETDTITLVDLRFCHANGDECWWYSFIH